MPVALTPSKSLAAAIDEYALTLLLNGCPRSSRLWRELANRVREDPTDSPCEGVTLDGGLDAVARGLTFGGFRLPFFWGIAGGVLLS